MQNLRLRYSAAGIHVFSRRLGLNVLFDEVQVPVSLWSRAPRHVSIALTNICDLHCRFCYAPKNKEMLIPEALKSWLAELHDNGCLGVGFGGGEPTLYPYLFDVCNWTANCTQMAVTLTTHAHHLKEPRVRKILGVVHFIRVSMDGVYGTYERLRGRSFTEVCRQIERLRCIVPFGLNYVVNSLTFPDLNEAVRLAAELGAAEFLLLPEQPVSGRAGIDGGTLDNLERWVRSYRGRVRLAVSEVHAQNLPTCTPLVKETDLFAYAHVNASGILKRSSFDQSGLPIGSSGIMQTLEKLRTRESEVQE